MSCGSCSCCYCDCDCGTGVPFTTATKASSTVPSGFRAYVTVWSWGGRSRITTGAGTATMEHPATIQRTHATIVRAYPAARAQGSGNVVARSGSIAARYWRAGLSRQMLDASIRRVIP